MWRHKTAGKNLQNNFTREWLMGFIFPGDTSPHGTGFSYASRDRLPTTPQLQQAQNIAAHRWVCTPESSRERGREREILTCSPSCHPPHLTGVQAGWATCRAGLSWWDSASVSDHSRGSPHVPGVRGTAPTLTPCASHSPPTFLRDI